MTRVFSFLVLSLFGLSLALFPLLEAGHEMLHHFENEIHHHQAGPHHTLADHHVTDHHDDGDIDDDDDDMTDFVLFLFGYLPPAVTTPFNLSEAFQLHPAEGNRIYSSICLSPPSPPPQEILPRRFS